MSDAPNDEERVINRVRSPHSGTEMRCSELSRDVGGIVPRRWLVIEVSYPDDRVRFLRIPAHLASKIALAAREVAEHFREDSAEIAAARDRGPR